MNKYNISVLLGVSSWEAFNELVQGNDVSSHITVGTRDIVLSVAGDYHLGLYTQEEYQDLLTQDNLLPRLNDFMLRTTMQFLEGDTYVS